MIKNYQKQLFVAFSITALMAGSAEASATNYAWGGYHDRSGLNKATDVFEYTRYDESTGNPASGKWVLSVLTTAGWNSGTDPNGWMYQSEWELQSGGSIVNRGEVYDMATNKWTSTSTNLATRTTHTYLFTKIYFSGSSIKYDWVAGLTGGGVATDTQTSTASGDPTTKFLAGKQDHSITGGTNTFKFFQYTVESNDVELNSVKVRQYSMGYTDDGGTLRNLSSYNGKSAEYPNGDNDEGTWITYRSSTGLRLGQADLTKMDADCANTTNCNTILGSGIVRWFEGTSVGNDTLLWP